MQFDKVRKKTLIHRLHRIHDIIISSASFILAYFIKKYLIPQPYGGLGIGPNYYLILLMIIVIWFILSFIFNIYDRFYKKSYLTVVADVIKISTIGIVILITLLYLLDIKNISRILLGVFYFTNIIFLTGMKTIIFVIVSGSAKKEYNKINLIIIGSKKRAQGAIALINAATTRETYNIIGCLDKKKSDIGNVVKDDVRIVGIINELPDILENSVVDEVLITMPLKKIHSIEGYIILMELVGIRVRIFPDWQVHHLIYNPGIATMKFDDFLGIPSLTISSTSSRHYDMMIKAMGDYISTALFFLFSLPLFILLGTAIKLSSKGPVFFKQERIGLNGRKFMLYKFRTMVQDAEKKREELEALNEADGPVFKIRKDPRIIPVIGTLLRKTSLDELPQLINVLKGEMSLVGPRPPIQSEVMEYNIWQRRRLSMKPGLTCIWQIAPNRNDLNFNQWMDMDLFYIDNWSLKMDIKLVFQTIFVVLKGHGR